MFYLYICIAPIVVFIVTSGYCLGVPTRIPTRRPTRQRPPTRSPTSRRPTTRFPTSPSRRPTTRFPTSTSRRPTTRSPTQLSRRPTATSRLPTPTGGPAALQIACNFIQVPSLTECLAKTSFSGMTKDATIPTEIGTLTKLTSLNLSAGFLNGSLPSELSKLINLASLLLNDNRFTGSVPSSLGKLTKLSKLTLYHTSLGGTIPAALCDSDMEILIECGAIKCSCCQSRFGGSCS